MRVLLLGGTAEARTIAAELAPSVDVISSLAGRVSAPRLPVGAARVGGFGGTAGLARFLRAEHVDAVVDATHPFAATITAHAAEAASMTGRPLLVLRRPGWTAGPGDDWTRFADISAAARHIARTAPGTVFLTSGRRDLAAFATDATHDYLVRAVDPPDGPVPPRMILLLARGPYTVDGELDLMRTHSVATLVTKDSGGALTQAKLVAARDLAVPVVMIDRPALPDGVDAVASVDAVTRWVGQLGSG